MADGSGILECASGKALLDDDGRLRLHAPAGDQCCGERLIGIRLQSGTWETQHNTMHQQEITCGSRAFDTDFWPNGERLLQWDHSEYGASVTKGDIVAPNGQSFSDRVIIRTPTAQVYYTHQTGAGLYNVDRDTSCLAHYYDFPPDNDPPIISDQTSCNTSPPAQQVSSYQGCSACDINRADQERENLGLVRAVLVMGPDVTGSEVDLDMWLAVQSPQAHGWLEFVGNTPLVINNGVMVETCQSFSNWGQILAGGPGAQIDPFYEACTGAVQQQSTHRPRRDLVVANSIANGVPPAGNPFANVVFYREPSVNSYSLVGVADWTASGHSMCSATCCSFFSCDDPEVCILDNDEIRCNNISECPCCRITSTRIDPPPATCTQIRSVHSYGRSFTDVDKTIGCYPRNNTRLWATWAGQVREHFDVRKNF